MLNVPEVNPDEKVNFNPDEVDLFNDAGVSSTADMKTVNQYKQLLYNGRNRKLFKAIRGKRLFKLISRCQIGLMRLLKDARSKRL